MIADAADDPWKGNEPVENDKGSREILLAKALDHATRVDMNRAGGGAGGRLFLNTLILTLAHSLAVHR